MAGNIVYFDDFTSRRTVADAIDVLVEKAHFGPAGQLALLVEPYELPWGDKVGQITTWYIHPAGRCYGVALPYAAKFSAFCGEQGRQELDVFCLDGAVADHTGRTQLKDGSVVRAIEVCRLDFPSIPTSRHYKIIKTVIAMNDAEARCSFPLKDVLPPDCPDMGYHETRFIDCKTLPPLKVPRRKIIARKYRETYGEEISTHTIAEALRLFGLRRIRRSLAA